MRFEEKEFQKFQTEKHISTEFRKLFLETPKNFEELKELALKYVDQVRHNTTNFENYRTVIYASLYAKFDDYYKQVKAEISKSLETSSDYNKQDQNDKITFLLQQEYNLHQSFSKTPENLTEVIDLILYIHDWSALPTLLLLISEKISVVSFDSELAKPVKRFFTFLLTLMNFFSKFNFQYFMEKWQYEEAKTFCIAKLRSALEKLNYKLNSDTKITNENILDIKKLLISNKEESQQHTLFEIAAYLIIWNSIVLSETNKQYKIHELYGLTGAMNGTSTKVNLRDDFNPIFPMQDLFIESLGQIMRQTEPENADKLCPVIFYLLVAIVNNPKGDNNFQNYYGKTLLTRPLINEEEFGKVMFKFLIHHEKDLFKIKSVHYYNRSLLTDFIAEFNVILNSFVNHSMREATEGDPAERHYKPEYQKQAIECFKLYQEYFTTAEFLLRDVPRSISSDFAYYYWEVMYFESNCLKDANMQGYFDLIAEKVLSAIKNPEEGDKILSSYEITFSNAQESLQWDKTAVALVKRNEYVEYLCQAPLLRDLHIYLKDEKVRKLFEKHSVLLFEITEFMMQLVITRPTALETDIGLSIKEAFSVLLGLKIGTKRGKDFVDALGLFMEQKEVKQYFEGTDLFFNLYVSLVEKLLTVSRINDFEVGRFFDYYDNSDQYLEAFKFLVKVADYFFPRLEKELEEQLAKVGSIPDDQLESWAYTMEGNAFLIYQGFSDILIAFLRDISDNNFEKIYTEFEPLFQRYSNLLFSEYVLFVYDDTTFRNQSNMWAGIFRSSDRKRQLLFKCFLNTLAPKIERAAQKGFSIANAENFIEQFHYTAFVALYTTKLKFQREEYEYLSIISIVLRSSTVFAFWSANHLNPEKEENKKLYERVQELAPLLLKFEMSFVIFCLKELEKIHSTKKDIFDKAWSHITSKFGELFKEICFLQSFFKEKSRELISKTLELYFKEAENIKESQSLSLGVKLAGAAAVDIPTILAQGDLASKLGIGDTKKFFQDNIVKIDIFRIYDTLFYELYKAKPGPKPAWTEFDSQFLKTVSSYYDLVESKDQYFHIGFIEVLKKIPYSYTDESNYREDLTETYLKKALMQIGLFYQKYIEKQAQLENLLSKDKSKEDIEKEKSERMLEPQPSIGDIKEEQPQLTLDSVLESELQLPTMDLDIKTEKNVSSVPEKVGESQKEILPGEIEKLKADLTKWTEDLMDSVGYLLFERLIEDPATDAFLDLNNEKFTQLSHKYLKYYYNLLKLFLRKLFEKEEPSLLEKYSSSLPIDPDFTPTEEDTLKFDEFTSFLKKVDDYTNFDTIRSNIAALFPLNDKDDKKPQKNIQKDPNLLGTWDNYKKYWYPELIEAYFHGVIIIGKKFYTEFTTKQENEKEIEAQIRIYRSIVLDVLDVVQTYTYQAYIRDSVGQEYISNLTSLTWSLREILDTISDTFNLDDENSSILAVMKLLLILDRKNIWKTIVHEDFKPILRKNNLRVTGYGSFYYEALVESLPFEYYVQTKILPFFQTPTDKVYMKDINPLSDYCESNRVAEVIKSAFSIQTNKNITKLEDKLQVSNLFIELQNPISSLFSKKTNTTSELIPTLTTSLSPFTKKFLDTILHTLANNYAQNLKALYAGKVEVKPYESNLQPTLGIWLDFLYILKEYPYLIPYFFLREIPNFSKINSELPKDIYHNFNDVDKKVTFLDFLTRIMIKRDKVTVLPLLNFIMEKSHYKVSIPGEGQYVDFSDILLSRFFQNIFELLDKETKERIGLETLDSIEIFDSLVIILDYYSQKATEEMVYFKENIRRFLKKIVRWLGSSTKKHFVSLRRILNEDFFNALSEIIKKCHPPELLDSGALSAERIQFYQECLVYFSEKKEVATSLPASLETLNKKFDEFIVTNPPEEVDELDSETFSYIGSVKEKKKWRLIQQKQIKLQKVFESNKRCSLYSNFRTAVDQTNRRIERYSHIFESEYTPEQQIYATNQKSRFPFSAYNHRLENGINHIIGGQNFTEIEFKVTEPSVGELLVQYKEEELKKKLLEDEENKSEQPSSEKITAERTEQEKEAEHEIKEKKPESSGKTREHDLSPSKESSSVSRSRSGGDEKDELSSSSEEVEADGEELNEKKDKRAEEQEEKKGDTKETGEGYKYFVRKGIRTQEDFENAVKKEEEKLKRRIEAIYVALYSRSCGSPSKTIITEALLDELFNFSDDFERNMLICMIDLYMKSHADLNLKEKAIPIEEEYERIKQDFPSYLEFLKDLRKKESPEEVEEEKSEPLEEVKAPLPPKEERKTSRRDSYENSYDDEDGGGENKVAPKDYLDNPMKFFEQATFCKDEADFRPPLSLKRGVKDEPLPEPKPLSESLKAVIPKLLVLDEEEIEALLNFFFLKMQDNQHDTFSKFRDGFVLNPYNQARLLDAMLFILYTPESFESGDNDLFPTHIWNSDEKGLEAYKLVAENILAYLAANVNLVVGFMSVPTRVIDNLSIQKVRNLKEKYNYENKIGGHSSMFDVIIGLLKVKLINEDYGKCEKILDFYRKLEEAPTLGEPNKHLPYEFKFNIGSIEYLFELLKTHWNSNESVTGMIKLFFVSMEPKPLQFLNIISPLFNIISQSIKVTDPKFSEVITYYKLMIRDNATKEIDPKVLDQLYTPELLNIELILSNLNSFYVYTLYDMSLSSRKDEKELHKVVYTKVENSLYKVCENLQTNEVQQYILRVFEILEHLYTVYGKTKIREKLIDSLVNIGISYCSLFTVKTEVSKEPLFPDFDEECDSPPLSKIVSRDFSEDLPAPEMRLSRSFSQIRKQSDIDFDLVYSNFGLKYSHVITSLLNRDGNIKPEIWHLNQKFPWIFELSTKREIFRQFVDEYLVEQSADYRENITVDRNHIVLSFMSHCIGKSRAELLQKLEINFEGEAGIDDGGLRREAFNICAKELFNPNNGLFRLSANKMNIEPSPYSWMVPYHLKLFEFAGIFLAKAISDNLIIDVQFSKPFLKHILGKQISVADLEDKDPELAKNLRWCLENDVTDLDFTFTYESEVFGEPITRELIPKGENIKVDNDNKKEYVKKFCGALMVKEIEPQIQAFLKGFRSLIPLKYISHLSSSEFELLITGVQVIDKEAMKRTCSYQNCSPDSQLAKWFWEILDEFQPEELSSFIYFLSGSTKLPYDGDKQRSIRLRKSNQSEQSLPLAHTCYFELETPAYGSKEMFREKLLQAMYEGKEGFYIA